MGAAMSSGRIFTVRFNLDRAFAELDGCLTDSDRLAWLAGFRFAVRGNAIPEAWSGLQRVGAVFGADAYAEASTWHAMQAEKGRLSAAARLSRTGSAAPVRSTTVEPQLNHGSNHGTNHGLNPSNIEHRTTSMEQPAAVAARAHARDPDPIFGSEPPPPPQPDGSLADLRTLHPAFLPLGVDDLSLIHI